MSAGIRWYIEVEDGIKTIDGIPYRNIVDKVTFYEKRQMKQELEKIKKKYPDKKITIFQKIESNWCEYPNV